MALCLWACDLVSHGRGMAPRVYALWKDLPDPRPRIAWSTTSAASARPRAVGFVTNLTSQQITDLNALPTVWARELPSNWRTVTWGQVPAGVRTRITTILGVNPGIVNGDTLPVAIRKMLQALDDATVTTLPGLESALGEPIA